MQGRTYKMEVAGKDLVIETGKYCEQAGGSVVVRSGDAVVLVSATVAKEARAGTDFLPLSIEFEEKMYAAGKIPGGFIKREGRPSEKAVLACRLIDRPLRPLFPKGFYNDIQVIATVLSMDPDVQPEILGMIGSSVALCISNAPFAGPTAAVAIGYVDGKYIINPTASEREQSRLQLTVAGTRDAVMMVEAGANEISEKEMLDAILLAHEEIKKIVDFINEIVAAEGKPKLEVNIYKPDAAFTELVRAYARDKVEWQLDTFDRKEREARSEQVKKETIEYFAETYPDSASDIDAILYTLTKEIVRDKIINRKIRPDGRAQDEIRPIWSEVGILPRVHGSAVFTRGQTQVMSIVTLGSLREGQTLDGIDSATFKRYMHQYNMPPYSVGEVRRVGSPGRREIGHGALAERAILPMLPSEEEFPYAIRAVSEVVSSNGSTSQASVCASAMSLMDAGVPLKKPVAGVAMGLIKDEANGNIAVLTDIQGLEDFLGDMDFKVAGTREGITAIQMDIKIKGINEEILTRALDQARRGRMFILDKMMETISAPKPELSPYAPRILQFTIHPDKIREVIGSGGKTINQIIADTGVKIDIEDDGRVFIASPDQEAAAHAKQMIETICHDIEMGEVFLGKVVNILPIGAQVELKPGKKGLVHISRLANHRVEKVEDEVKIGDEILVRVIAIKPDGKIDLTRKELLPDAKN